MTYLWSSKKAKHRVAISVYVDANYIPPATYVVEQLLALRGARKIDIIIVSEDLEGLKNARKVVPEARFVHIEPDFRPFGFNVPDDFNSRSFLNLFSPHIFKGEYDRLICVDADYHMLQDDMFNMADLNMKTYPLAAQKDTIALNVEFAEANHKRYLAPAKMHASTPYLNGGFQVIDCAAWIDEKIAERALQDTLDRGGPKYLGDQRALNAVLQGDWMELSPNCNWAAVWPLQNPIDAHISVMRAQPSGLHLLGAAKPWIDKRPKRIMPAIAELQRAFFERSPWPDYVPKRDFTPAIEAIARRSDAMANRPLADLFPEQVRHYLFESEFHDIQQGLAPNLELYK